MLTESGKKNVASGGIGYSSTIMTQYGSILERK